MGLETSEETKRLTSEQNEWKNKAIFTREQS